MHKVVQDRNLCFVIYIPQCGTTGDISLNLQTPYGMLHNPHSISKSFFNSARIEIYMKINADAAFKFLFCEKVIDNDYEMHM